MSEKRKYYKYRPLYSDRGNKIPHEFTQSIIEKCQLYYATPSSFNDPFDCSLKLHVNDATDDEWNSYLKSLIAQTCNTEEKKTLELGLENCKKLQPKINLEFEDQYQKIYEKSSVLSLSKKADSISMFSYYADNHYGVAIEFTFADTEFPCGIPLGDVSTPENLYGRKITVADVSYSPEFPGLNYFRLKNSPLLIKHLIFTKFKDWSHEEEFRIFRREVPAASVNFPPQILTNIIFGTRANTDTDDINLVKGWLSTHKHPPVILAQAKQSTSKFELDIHDLETVY